LRLEIGNIMIKDVQFGAKTEVNEGILFVNKERSSDMTAQLVEFMGADGVIISEEGFGNPDADLVMNCAKIEKKGIKTVLITSEYAGRDGASQSLADSSEYGDAVISVGNANEIIKLPAMKTVIGYPEVADTIAGGFAGNIGEDGSITAELQVIIGSTNEFGVSYLTAREC
jgi:sarcosine reductase